MSEEYKLSSNDDEFSYSHWIIGDITTVQIYQL